MKLEQAARSALEALREYRDTQMIQAPRKAITALREALDHIADTNKMIGCAYCNNPLFAGTKCNNCGRVTLAEQAEQEPVAWKDMAFARLGVVRDKMRPEDVAVVQRFLDGDYAAPVRTKDLTDDEIVDIWNRNFGMIDRCRAVIQEFRRKNGIV